MTRDIFSKKIIEIKKTPFKYRLFPLNTDLLLKNCLDDIEKLKYHINKNNYDNSLCRKNLTNSYKNLKKVGFIKNKTEMATVLGYSREHLSKIISGKELFPVKKGGEITNKLKDYLIKKLLELL